MAYSISFSIVDSTGDEFNVVKESGWHYEGTAHNGRNLEPAISYIWERWCDLVVDLEDDATAKDFHPRYYTGGGAQQLRDQSPNCKATISDGTVIKLNFSVTEGNRLRADLKIGEGPILFSGQNHVKNDLGPDVKSITVYFIERTPVEIPTGAVKILKGRSNQCIVKYNNGTRRRCDISIGYQFKEFVDVNITPYGNDIRAKSPAGIGGEWKLVV
uniref:Agaricus bisporus lectin n=1 Tax=Coccidioides posadasii RMSCC 3488 TaxID=454284 RepID=A0A0J6F799_COCPO|nr:agaricus bisporus lectin [Coccidioides posadasii RMSCC 3488]